MAEALSAGCGGASPRLATLGVFLLAAAESKNLGKCKSWFVRSVGRSFSPRDADEGFLQPCGSSTVAFVYFPAPSACSQREKPKPSPERPRFAVGALEVAGPEGGGLWEGRQSGWKCERPRS